MKTIYVGGTFDLVHDGHLFVFRQMRDLAGPDGKVVIGLNRDGFVERFKGHPTVQKFDERRRVLEALRIVDLVVVNIGDEDSKPVLEVVGPDIIAVGQDWYSPDDSKYCAQMDFTPDWLAERGIALHYMDFMPGFSSTNLRQTAAAR